jgi:DNA-binding CsgD family transcriptional regulator
MQQGQLSLREREVAALIARGMTNAEIALSLGLSAATVKHYVETAMRKAGVTNRVSLAMWLRDHEEGAG